MPTALLVEAAQAATQADAPELGARLAELAVDAGAGGAALILARAYTLRKRFADAERVLAGIEGALETQDQAVDYIEQRVSAVLYYGLKRPAEARALLERAQPGGRAMNGDGGSSHAVSLQSMTDGLRDSVEVFERMLADPKLGTAARRHSSQCTRWRCSSPDEPRRPTPWCTAAVRPSRCAIRATGSR